MTRTPMGWIVPAAAAGLVVVAGAEVAARGDVAVGVGMAAPMPPPNVAEDVTIKLSASPRRVKPGDEVVYKVIVTPQRGEPAEGAGFRLDLGKVLDDADVGPAKATLGDVSRSGKTLTWEADLPPDTPAEITFTASVHKPDRGNGLLDTKIDDKGYYNYCEDPPPSASCSTTVKVLKPHPGPHPKPHPKPHPTFAG